MGNTISWLCSVTVISVEENRFRDQYWYRGKHGRLNRQRGITAAKMSKTKLNIKKYIPKHYQCKNPWSICSICLRRSIYLSTSSRHLNCRYLHNSCISQAINHSCPNNGPSGLHGIVQKYRKYRKHLQNLAYYLLPQTHHTCLNSATIAENVSWPTTSTKNTLFPAIARALQLFSCLGTHRSQLHSEFSISFHFHLTQLFGMNEVLSTVLSENCWLKTRKTKIPKLVHLVVFKLKYFLELKAIFKIQFFPITSPLLKAQN